MAVKCGNRSRSPNSENWCEKDDMCQLVVNKNGVRSCRPTAKNVPGKSAFKDEPGYSCVGPQGPPYRREGEKPGAVFDRQFRRIEANIIEDPENSSCYVDQAVQLFNIMTKTRGLSGKSKDQKKRSLDASPTGRKILRAYCGVLKASEKKTGRKTGSFYCR